MATQTPARPVPGAYFQTPAPSFTSRNDPVRRRLFTDGASNPPPSLLGTRSSFPLGGSALAASSSERMSGGSNPWTEAARASGASGLVSSAAGASGAVPMLPPVATLAPIQKAARCVNETLLQDESYPDIDSYYRRQSSDYDLQPAESSWAPFQRINMYPIPDRVFEHIQRANVNMVWGLFAEIGYAYIALDNTLLMWNFSQPHPEVVGYEESPHIIRAVALVPPKPGVFLASITHILVVGTTTELILLGVAASSSPNGQKSIELYSTKMTINTPSNNINLIEGTASGRIFFGGDSDTDVYELAYQKEEKWFSGRCQRINHSQSGWASIVPRLPPAIDSLISTQHGEHLTQIAVDDSRNLVYTLSNKSTIRTYHMDGPDTLVKVIEKEKNHCLRDITHLTTASPLLTDRMSIVSISAISAQEAYKLHLMALTNTGCRIFLSATSSASYSLTPSANIAPQSMQVQFVKFPPKEVGAARRGTASYDAAGDAPLDMFSRALQTSKVGFRFPPGYFFDFVTKPEDPNTDLLFASAPETGRIKATVPATALKFYEHSNWVEMGQGRALAVGLINKPIAAAKQPLGFGNELAVQFDEPPCDAAVLTNSGVYVVRRRRMVDIFATTIRGAVGDEVLEREVRKFIQLYGRVETVSAALAVACGQGNDLRTGTSRVIDQGTADRAKTVFVAYGGQPTLTESDSTLPSTDSIRLSSRHDALALYLTRLVRMLWKARVIMPRIEKAGGVVVNSTIPTGKLTIVQENLERLRKFLDTNRGIIQGLSGPSDLQRVASRQEEIALQAEHQALHSLQKLMEGISEGISFVLMLFDERVADIYMRLDDISRQQLNDLTYETLFSQSAGKELAKLLVKAIVNRNIESGSNVETVADALRRRCGSFCSPDDVIIFKAQEQLKRGSEQASQPNVQRTLLNESLRLFQRVAGSLSFANLGAAVEQYTELKYYAGAIELCLTVAREKDRGNSALAWINENKPAGDPRENAFNDRKRCYNMIHLVLQQLDASSGAEAELIDGKPTLSATKRMEAYAVVNDSDDEVFHFDLYEWYIEQKWTDRILAIDNPHVVTFLQRLAAVNAQHAELLCRFYTHRHLFFDAAQVQYGLAISDFEVGIKDRITLLSRAKSNASVQTLSGQRKLQQELIHDISEMLQIAHIQDDLLERLKADTRLSDERKVDVVQALDGQIQGLTDLFNTYADPGGYYDLSLLIYHAAEYHHPRAIAETWRNLIESTHHDVEERIEAYREQQLQPPPRRNAAAAAAELVLDPPPYPYEAVSMQIQNIAHRTSLDGVVFPVDPLLPIVCDYAIAQEQDRSMGADDCWPVLLFLQLQVSQAVIARVLERVFDSQESPFTGRRARRLVVEWICCAVESWLRDVERLGGTGGIGGGLLPAGEASQMSSRAAGKVPASSAADGAAGLGSWVYDLLGRAADEMGALVEGVRDRDRAAVQEVEDVARKARSLRAAVEKVVRQGGGMGGSLGASFRFL